MRRFITFGSIGQFRNVIRNVQEETRRVGYDAELGEPIIDDTIPMPTIDVTASEKIHGTNASVCYSNHQGFWVQSRTSIIDLTNDNAGCFFYANSIEQDWMILIERLAEAHNINLDTHIISVYFEWCGGKIQKNSAVSGLDKRAVIFQHFKVSPVISGTDDGRWIETKDSDGNWVCKEDCNIFNVMNSKSWSFAIDFSKPRMSVNTMSELVLNDIEPNSPIGSSMGKEKNVGEGMVCTFEYKGNLHKFKVKGDKHSASKVKILQPVDEIKEQKKIDFVNVHACTSSRLEQAWQTVFGINNKTQTPDIRYTGDFLRAVINDVMKEELDILINLNIEPKEINGMISKMARTWFMTALDKEVMK